MTAGKVRCGIIGLHQGLEDMYVTLQHPRFDLRAVCDRNASRQLLYASRQPVGDVDADVGDSPGYLSLAGALRSLTAAKQPDFEVDYRALLARPDLDAIIITTPDATHANMTMAALDAGKYVLCAKPMALDMDSGRRICDAARCHPNHYMLGLEVRHSNFAKTVASIVSTGALGRVHSVRFDFHRGPLRRTHRKRNAPVDGAIIKEGTHWIDLFSLFSGGRIFTRVAGFGDLRDPDSGMDFEDNGAILVDYGDLRASHAYSYISDSSTPEDFCVIGDRGHLAGSFSDFRVETQQDSRLVSINNMRYAHQLHIGYAEMYDAFASVVLDGAVPPTGWQLAYENLLTCYAAQLAMSERRVVARAELLSTQAQPV
jgi:predicted dehydrogenase